MARQHYERAFEAWLQRDGIPTVLVEDARRAILEPGAVPGPHDPAGPPRRLKSFDFVAYGGERHALIEVKGRRVDLRRGGSGRRESWTTAEDIRSMSIWERLFGEPFSAVLVFLYWLDGPAALSGETRVFRFEGRAYAHRAVGVRKYARAMRARSPRWGTVDLPAEAFERLGTDLRSWFDGGAGRARAGVTEARFALLGGSIGVGAGAGAGLERPGSVA
jgi:hypothetical protein